MMAKAETLENKILALLLKEGKEEMITDRLRISARADSRIEIVELPSLDPKQMKLPPKKSQKSKKGEGYESTNSN